MKNIFLAFAVLVSASVGGAATMWWDYGPPATATPGSLVSLSVKGDVSAPASFTVYVYCNGVLIMTRDCEYTDTENFWTDGFVVTVPLNGSQAYYVLVGPDGASVSAAINGVIPAGQIETLNNIECSANPVFGSGEVLVLRGWAADANDGAIMPRVEVKVDGQSNFVAQRTGLARPDVAAAQNNQDWGNSGWEAYYVLPAVSSGNVGKWFDVVAYDRGGAQTLLGSVYVTVRADMPRASLLAPANVTVARGAPLTVLSRAVVGAGTIGQHLVEVRNPSGSWSNLGTIGAGVADSWGQLTFVPQTTGSWRVRSKAYKDSTYWRYDERGVLLAVTGNSPPTASFSPSVSSGSSPLTVTFSAAASSDSDGSIAKYEWDFDGDGIADATGSQVNRTFYYHGPYARTYGVGLAVYDNAGAVATATTTITVQGSNDSRQTLVNTSGYAPESDVATHNITTSQLSTLVVSCSSSYGSGWVEGLTPTYSNGSTLVFAEVSAGTYTIKIGGGYNGDAEYEGDYTLLAEQVNGRSPQTISFPALTNPGVGGNTITLAATASSGLSTRYSIVSGPGSISGNTLTITGPGPITVRSLQDGNASYWPASPVDRTMADALPEGIFETLNGVALAGGPLSVRIGEVLEAVGWAADNEDGSQMAAVRVNVDGQQVGTATLGFERSDIAAYHSGWGTSGWKYYYTVPALAAGYHVMEIRSVDSRGFEMALTNPRGFWVSSTHVYLAAPVAATVPLNLALPITTEAVAPDAGLTLHGIQVRNASGVWSHETTAGWAQAAIFNTSLTGTPYSSRKSGTFVLDAVGEWRVRAVARDTTGAWRYSSAEGIPITVVSASPPAPPSLGYQAGSATATTATFSWGAVMGASAGNIIRYRLYSSGALKLEVDAPRTSATVGSLSSGTQFTFTVRAYDATTSFESADSNQVTFSTISAADTDSDTVPDAVETKLGTSTTSSTTTDTTSFNLKIHRPN